MSRQSGFLLKQEQRERDLLLKAQGIVIQYMIDTLQITMNEEHGWGYDKLDKLMYDWKKRRILYQPVLEPRNPESDVMREHMQRVFRKICERKKIDPVEFEDRYPYLNPVRYDRRK
jgi:hypothetical protein